MKEIVTRITEQAQKNGIQGKELGQMLGLKKSPLTDWKNEKSKPTLEQVIKLCEIFAVSTEWLITGKDPGNLTEDEQKLIDTYRNCNPVGQQLIRDQAENIKKQLPTDRTEEQAAQISTSKIG